ncbi:geminin coiled-coil domain-containing protein 1 isoform X2 [Rhinatrema bivittatum]|uniref:geminin coiled-coil domain-containing protein 1 isoform X2 n=1 Tax=Rhinatrema bivittatum TaxID=194408 RepID=UPI00112E9673|nr:geminin coiled-coil domain-containing protein 1 isoform X2 [Rhinatrema bivittatum]
MSTILSCQDQYFAGGQGYDCPYSAATSAASVDVSKETWVSFWAAGIRDNSECQHESQAQDLCDSLDYTDEEEFVWEDPLSSQLHKNKQLQDTLLQKNEELARLYEENNKLKQYLNSTFLKCLEENAKKLSQHGLRADGTGKIGRRKTKEDNYPAQETHPKRARRNLFNDFAACEKQPSPAVDSWVLQTLGLKDINTIDDSLLANCSALPSELVSSSYNEGPLEAMDYGNGSASPAAYGCDHVMPISTAASPSGKELTCAQHLSPPAYSSVPLPSSVSFTPSASPPYYTASVSPNKTEVAFSTSLNPHRNVKTHTFAQGQAFVRRDEEGGWRFTWVPKQPE